VIRHAITRAGLERRIEEIRPGWLARARSRTATLPTRPAKAKFSGIWSEIKMAYIGLQGSKCAFCEKWLEDDDIEHDVEHFRPKGAVTRWMPSRSLAEDGVVVNQPASGCEPGYRFLAYNPLNYAASCKQCNSILKKDRFPIRGTRRPDERDVVALAAEEAYLVYPIGDVDDDPEALIEFAGISPRPRGTGFGRLRALVIIEFFQLDDVDKRGGLMADRAEFIEKLHWSLKQRDRNESAKDVDAANQIILRLTNRKFRHANCLRSFERLYRRDRAAAGEYARLASEFLDSYVPRSARTRLSPRRPRTTRPPKARGSR
jgi:hypothetical protein